MRKINIMGIRSKVILNKTLENYLIMQSISEEEETAIDNAMDSDDVIKFVLEGKYVISIKDIFLYGHVDITNKDDIQVIKNSKIITEEVNGAANVPSKFSYKSGEVYSDKEGIFRCHDTWDKIKWFKFNHILLGKPERIIIYKINKKHVSRNRSTIVRNNNNVV